jgi:hypothetical protein
MGYLERHFHQIHRKL